MTESESVALPLGDAAMFYFVLFVIGSAPLTCDSISKETKFVNSFFKKILSFFKKFYLSPLHTVFRVFEAYRAQKPKTAQYLFIKIAVFRQKNGLYNKIRLFFVQKVKKICTIFYIQEWIYSQTYLTQNFLKFIIYLTNILHLQKCFMFFVNSWYGGKLWIF